MKANRLICILFLPLVIWPATLSADPKTDLAGLVAPALPINLYDCPEDEVENARSDGYQLWCAQSEVKFKELRKSLSSFLKGRQILEPRNALHWINAEKGVRSFRFWFRDQGGMILFRQKDNLVRILLRDAARSCDENLSGNVSEIRKEAVTLLPTLKAPEKIRDKSPIWPERSPGTLDHVSVFVNMILDKEGVPRDLCILGTEPEHVPRFREAAVDAILEWRYEPVIQDGKRWVIFYGVRVEFTSAPLKMFDKDKKKVEPPDRLKEFQQ